MSDADIRRILGERQEAREAESATSNDDAGQLDGDDKTEESAEAQETQSDVSEEVAEGDEVEDGESHAEEDFAPYVEIDGRQITVDQIKEWESGTLRQADYTQKTQATSELSKSLNEKHQKLDTIIESMESQIKSEESETVDGMTLDELMEVDPGKYLTHVKSIDKKKKALESARKIRDDEANGQRSEREKAVQAEVLAANPDWIEGGQMTDKYNRDMSLVKDYMVSNNFTAEDQQAINSSKVWLALLDAARGSKTRETAKANAKKARAVPVVKKPGRPAITRASAELKEAQDNHRLHGTVETATALRRAKRKTVR